MDFNEVINKRRTSREWTNKDKGLGYSLCIPLNKEHNVALNQFSIPQSWMVSYFISVGYPKEDKLVLEQYNSKPDGHIHMGAW